MNLKTVMWGKHFLLENDVFSQEIHGFSSKIIYHRSELNAGQKLVSLISSSFMISPGINPIDISPLSSNNLKREIVDLFIFGHTHHY